MTVHVADAAERRMLELILNVTPPEDLTLRLFMNDQTPADGDTEADYDDLTGHDYVPIDLDAGDWGFAPGNPSIALQPQQIFALSPGVPVTVYGYFLTWEPSGTLAWKERLATPQLVELLPVEIKVTPRFTLNKAA